MSKLPEGKFVCCSTGEQSKWYVSDGHTKEYIPKSQHKLAEKLAYKRYLELYLDELVSEYKASIRYADSCSKIKNALDLLIRFPEIKSLTSNYFMPLSEELREWSMETYVTNPYHLENLIHKSCSGNLLRSKSEVIIDMSLFNAKIPYRYECQLVLGKNIVYPDFTLRHPVNGKILYWEHFGQMDNPEYASKACDKIKLYVSCGIIPSINLITTYETKDNPLTSDKVKKIIEEYLN